MARELFAAGGFHATSMDDVAEAAGVTKPVLYQHFPSKRALYVELLEDVGQRLMERLAEAAASVGGGRELVEGVLDSYFRFVTDNAAAFRLLFGASVRNDAEFAQVAERVLEQLTDAVARMMSIDLSQEHRRVLAHAVVGMAEGVSRRALFDPKAEHDPVLLTHWTAELAWYGLRGIRTGDDAWTPGREP